MSARGRFFVTPHAVRQYQRRVRPELGYEDARAELIAISERARYVRPARDGCEVWRTPRPERLRLIVGPGKGPLPALITVETRCDAD